MKKLQAPTILHLTLFGFFVVLLPLLLGTLRGFQTLERMATRHKTDMSNIVVLTESVRMIHGNLENLERSARQYQLIGDDAFRVRFNERYSSIQAALKDISSMERTEKLEPIIRIVLKELAELKIKINGNDIKSEAFTEALSRFERLFFLIRTLSQESSLFLNERVEDAQTSADSVSRELLLYVVTLLPLTFFLVLIFTVLILKPLRQIDIAIRKLGQGDYKRNFEVQGPMDLKRVAQRLNWLGRRLADSEEEKKRFLRHISHELKTPLSTIKEGTELLEDEIPGTLNENQKEVVGILSKAVSSFQGLINNLLDFNILKANPNLQAEDCDVNEIVNETIGSHQLTAHRKKLAIKLDGAAMKVKADRSILRAALDNLVSNAVHYTPKGGFVEISWARKENQDFVFKVVDSGPGIPEEERQKVFLPFYQGTARKQGPLKGTGLGLSVAKECVESHGGQLKIEDSKIGAHFTLTIPKSVEAQEVL